MEHTLRCNSLKCRKELNDHAVVTTCSHVFCVDCSNRFQLSSQSEGQRPVCPACQMHLTNPDDVVVTNLRPTEDYKTSVLSGLSPNIVMECAGRALSFWAYQTTQEIVYQEYLAKNLTDKYAALNTQMEKIISDANTEITNMRNKMSNMHIDQTNLRRKNEELHQAFQEKSRKLLQTQSLYDKLKRRDYQNNVQDAAADAVDHTVQTVAAHRYTDYGDHQNDRSNKSSILSSIQNNDVQYSRAGLSGNTTMAPPSIGFRNPGVWTSNNSRDIGHHNQPIQTPSTHRQRLVHGNPPNTTSNPRVNGANLALNIGTTPNASRNSAGRSPLASLNGNITSGSGFAGYGMSGGLKAGHPTTAGVSPVLRPAQRSRATQRPATGISANLEPMFETRPTTNLFTSGESYY